MWVMTVTLWACTECVCVYMRCGTERYAALSRRVCVGHLARRKHTRARCVPGRRERISKNAPLPRTIITVACRARAREKLKWKRILQSHDTQASDDRSKHRRGIGDGRATRYDGRITVRSHGPLRSSAHTAVAEAVADTYVHMRTACRTATHRGRPAGPDARPETKSHEALARPCPAARSPEKSASGR